MRCGPRAFARFLLLTYARTHALGGNFCFFLLFLLKVSFGFLLREVGGASVAPECRQPRGQLRAASCSCLEYNVGQCRPRGSAQQHVTSSVSTGSCAALRHAEGGGAPASSLLAPCKHHWQSPQQLVAAPLCSGLRVATHPRMFAVEHRRQIPPQVLAQAPGAARLSPR